MEPIVERALESALNTPVNVQIFKDAILRGRDNDEIRDVLYEVVTHLKNGKSTKDTFKKLAKNELGFHGDAFQKQRRSQQEEDDFITSPAEIVEGVLECPRPSCGSNRTVSFTMQTSSGDEATSVWAQCADCKKIWHA